MYLTLALVVMLATFLLLVPQNISDTIADRSFITYNGIGDSDLMISLRQTDSIAEKEARIADALKHDPDVSAFSVLTSRLHEVADEPVRGRIKMDTGDHDIFPIAYAEGRVPASDDEIALSVLTADDYGKSPGDTLTLLVDGTPRTLRVTGLYSDITNGGKTAKALFSTDADILWSTAYVKCKEGVDLQKKMRQYAAQYPDAAVAEIGAYFTEMTGTLTDALQTASVASAVVTVLLVYLVTLLFVRLLAVKDRKPFAVMKILGFTDREVQRQLLARTLLTGGFAIATGILLSGTLGEAFATALVGSFGVARLHFVNRPLFVFVAAPALLLFVIWLSTRLGARGSLRTELSQSLKE